MYKCLSFACSLITLFAVVSIISPKVSAKTNRPTHKTASVTHSAGLTTAQKAADFAALKSLRRLQAATEVGVSYVDYSSRLIDVKADVSDNLDNLPNGQLKQKLNAAMDAYADARTAWGEIIEYGYWDVIKGGETGKIVRRRAAEGGVARKAHGLDKD